MVFVGVFGSERVLVRRTAKNAFPRAAETGRKSVPVGVIDGSCRRTMLESQMLVKIT
jgi:hypothetical protein